MPGFVGAATLTILLLGRTAIAEPLDLDAYGQAKRAEASPQYRQMASEKRLESIQRLKELLGRGVKGETKAEMMLRLADLYFQQGLHVPEGAQWLEKAIAIYGTVIHNYPTYQRIDQCHFFKGRGHQVLGQSEPAIESFEAVIRAYPESRLVPDAWVALADQRARDGDGFKAVVALQKTVGFPDGKWASFAQHRLGWVYIDLGESTKAREAFLAAATGDDPLIEGIAIADLEAQYGDELSNEEIRVIRQYESRSEEPPPPSPKGPPTCADKVPQLRERIEKRPDDAPQTQLRIVKCYAAEGDRGRARSELARMENEFGPKSRWAQQRSKAEVRSAKDALKEATKAVK